MEKKKIFCTIVFIDRNGKSEIDIGLLLALFPFTYIMCVIFLFLNILKFETKVLEGKVHKPGHDIVNRI